MHTCVLVEAWAPCWESFYIAPPSYPLSSALSVKPRAHWNAVQSETSIYWGFRGSRPQSSAHVLSHLPGTAPYSWLAKEKHMFVSCSHFTSNSLGTLINEELAETIKMPLVLSNAYNPHILTLCYFKLLLIWDQYKVRAASACWGFYSCTGFSFFITQIHPYDYSSSLLLPKLTTEPLMHWTIKRSSCKSTAALVLLDLINKHPEFTNEWWSFVLTFFGKFILFQPLILSGHSMCLLEHRRLKLPVSCTFTEDQADFYDQDHEATACMVRGDTKNSEIGSKMVIVFLTNVCLCIYVFNNVKKLSNSLCNTKIKTLTA